MTSPDVQAVSIFEAEKCDIINIEQVHYGILALKSGNAEDYLFTLNGEEIHPTAVNDQKTIVKFEVNPNEKAVVKAAEKMANAGSLTIPKLDYVVQMLEKRGITVTPEVRAMIEAAVQDLDIAIDGAIGQLGDIFIEEETTVEDEESETE